MAEYTKNKFLSRQSLLIYFTTLVLLFVAAVPHTFAQSGGKVSKNGSTTQQTTGDNLRISPLRNEVTAKPGETVKVRVYIQNLTAKPTTLKAINNDFVAGSKEDGTPNIILNENEYAPTHSLKRFMQPIPNVTTAPSERKPVDVTIVVPANAQSGGYYGAIRFAPALADGNSSVVVSGSVSSLILLTVPGNLVENLQLKDFDIRQNQRKASRLATPENIDVLIRLENKGNVQLTPFGDIYVQKGDKVIYAGKINNSKPVGLVLPDSKRVWTVPISGMSNFGKYKVVATIGYGGNGQTINIEKTFWIVPTAYILGAIGGAVGLILLVVAIMLSLRSYKRRIMRHTRRRR